MNLTNAKTYYAVYSPSALGIYTSYELMASHFDLEESDTHWGGEFDNAKTASIYATVGYNTYQFAKNNYAYVCSFLINLDFNRKYYSYEFYDERNA